MFRGNPQDATIRHASSRRSSIWDAQPPGSSNAPASTPAQNHGPRTNGARIHDVDAGTFLELKAGTFHLALRAKHVAGVVQQVREAPILPHPSQGELPLADLRLIFTGEARPILPYAVLVEHLQSHTAVGVCGVGHVRRDDLPALQPVPSLGLTQPALFEGALRHEDRLLLVMEPGALTNLVLQNSLQI